MANWKKVIVSGSNAELNTVTASFFSGDGSALTNVPAGSLNIESFTDGTAITVATTDKLILSDAGTEKFIQVSQLPFTTANVSTDLSTTLSTTAVRINSSDGTNATRGGATTSAAGIMTKAIFDEHVLNNAKVTNSHNNDVSVANLKTRLAGGFGSNAVQIGDSDDVVTIGNKLVVTGDLQVSGTTTTVDTNNLNVKDQFINLNDGGSAADGGLVVEGAGAAFGWDNDKGRWAFDLAGATEGQTSITSDAYAVSVHNGNVGAQLSGYEKVGNMYVDKLEDIWIYTV